MRFLPALLIFCLSLSLNAHPDERTLTLYFDKDVDQLSSVERDKLSSFLEELNQDDCYKEIFVYGHTDSDGNTTYNQELSRRRARNVFDMLRSSLPYPGIFIDALGERFPAVRNDNEHHKSLNRRVDILVKRYLFRNGSDILLTANNTQTQQFVLQADQKNDIITASGFRFIFNPDIFALPEGVDPHTALINIHIREVTDWRGALTHNIRYESGGRPLESGGMFYIEARYNNSSIQLKQGKNYEISIPTTRDYDDMKVFTGITDSSGISWALNPAPFSMTSSSATGGKPDSSYAIDSAVIQNWKIRPYQDTLLYDFSLDISLFPAKPVAPVKPIRPSKIAVERFEKQNTDRLSRKKRAAYNLAVSKYDADTKRFDSAIEKYRIDSAAYKYRLGCYNDSIAAYRQQLNAARRKLWAFRYAVLENDIIQKWPVIKKNLIIMNNKRKFNFSKADSITRNLAIHYNKLSNKNPHYERLHHWSLQLYQAYRRLYPNSSKYADYSRWFKNEGDGRGIYLFDGYINTNISMLLMQDTAVNNYFARDQAFSPGAPIIQKFLSASLNQMGWINCDRFYNYPPQTMTELYVQANSSQKERAYIIFRSMNSVLNMSLKPSNTYAANIPKNMPFTLLIIGLDENNNPVYYIEKFDQLQQPKKIAPRYTTCNISELPDILEKVM